MLIIENFMLAINSLRSNKMRALLTMLGIIIGISSVIAIVSIGNSVSKQTEDEMKNFGMERVTIDHFEKNKRADYLYQKIGFQNEGLMRNAGKKNGKYVNLQLMSMLRSEYYDKIHTK